MLMDYLPVAKGWTSVSELPQFKDDLDIAVRNLLTIMAFEKQNAWKEGFKAAVAQYEDK